MPYADPLNPSAQFLMIGLLIVAFGAFLTRAVLFARREYAGIRPVYPGAWSAAQCRSLEYFRLLVGLALIPLWGFFLFIAPSMPTNWPFAYTERSEEHTSELQSHLNLVCRLLLEKKKTS